MTHKIISFLSILLLSLPLVACSTDDSEVETPFIQTTEKKILRLMKWQ